MVIVTAYFPDMPMDAYDGSQEMVIITNDGRQFRPAITSSIGDEAEL